MKNFKYLLFSLFFMFFNTIQTAHAGDEWYLSATVSAMPGTYSGSVQRDNLFSGSLWLNADYLDRLSFAVAYNTLSLSFKDTGSGAFDVNQDAFAGRFQYHFFVDAIGGKLTTQLVMHAISNDDGTGFTDNVDVIAPKIAYINFNNDMYLDVEYTQSKYNNSNLTVDQISPSMGFGFNQKADWLRLKAYLINTSDKNLSQGEDSLASIDVKWTHWLAPDAMLGINNFFIDVLAGERIFAVDNDAFSVYNLADIQQGSFSFGLAWKYGDDIRVSAIAGIEKYENKIISNAYDQQYFYISFTKDW